MTNPPYGKRIYAEDEALLALYDLMSRPQIQGRRLSPDHRLSNHHLFTKKLIKNGPDEIIVWKKG
jgi:23S rRNA G2445 N2-methylase RlmL